MGEMLHSCQAWITPRPLFFILIDQQESGFRGQTFMVSRGWILLTFQWSSVFSSSAVRRSTMCFSVKHVMELLDGLSRSLVLTFIPFRRKLRWLNWFLNSPLAPPCKQLYEHVHKNWSHVKPLVACTLLEYFHLKLFYTYAPSQLNGDKLHVLCLFDSCSY